VATGAALTTNGLFWGDFDVMWKGQPIVMADDTRLALAKLKEQRDSLIPYILYAKHDERHFAFR